MNRRRGPADQAAMVCDHEAPHSGTARYLRDTAELRMALVCDRCGAEREEIGRIDYQPNGRCFLALLSELTARELGLPQAQIARVRFAALICDVGRDHIPAEILGKRGPLTDDEWVEVRQQPGLGAALLSDTSFDDIREWILTRRERSDGTGYPRGLTCEQIPVEARVLAVTEAYLAMTSDRPHRSALSPNDAAAELLRCAGTQFDATVVDAFMRGLAHRDSQLQSLAA